MITKQDYADLIEKILDPGQPSYTYLSYHRRAVLCLLDTAPKAMRYGLILPLIVQAFQSLAGQDASHDATHSARDQLSWRYELLRRVTKAGNYPQQFLDFFTVKESDVAYGMSDYLVWIDVIAKQFGIRLTGRYTLALIDAHHYGPFDKQRVLAKNWLNGDELEVVLFRIQRYADTEDRHRAQEAYYNSPG